LAEKRKDCPVNFARTVSLLVLPSVCAWGATTYDFVEQFSTNQNPSGVWSYGSRDSVTGAFTLYPTNWQGDWGFFAYTNADLTGPRVWLMGMAAIGSGQSQGAPVLVVGCRPDGSFPDAWYPAEQPTLRFTAPQPGTYGVHFTAGSEWGDAEFVLRLNDQGILDQLAPVGQTITNSVTVDLITGGVLNLTVVNQGGLAGARGLLSGTVTLTTSNPPPAITFYPSGGLFTNSLTVLLMNNLSSGVVNYTTNGPNPTVSSERYSAPIVITAAAEIRAAVFDNGAMISQVCTASYARVYAIDDEFPASWREQYFGAGYLTDPRVSREADPDADGSTNWEEYLAATHPLDNTSGFKAAVEAVPQIRFAIEPWRTYRIIRRDRFGSEPTVVATVNATNTVSTFVDTSVTLGTGFYVLELLPP